MPLIPALRRERQTDLCEFAASLVYRSTFRTIQTNPVSKSAPAPTNAIQYRSTTMTVFIITDCRVQAKRSVEQWSVNIRWNQS